MKTKTQKIVWGLALTLLALSGCSQNSSQMQLAGDRHMSNGNYQGASQQYRTALAEDDNTALSLRLSMALIKSERYDAGLTELNRLNHSSPKADYLKAVCYMGLNDVANAKAHLEKSLKARPNDALALSLLGRVHFLQRHYPQSVETYQEALAVSSDPVVREKILYNLAISQMQAGQFAAADQTFNQYLTKHAYVSEHDDKLAGAIAYAAGDRQRALNHWKKLAHKERKAILNAIDNDATTYQVLAVN